MNENDIKQLIEGDKVRHKWLGLCKFIKSHWIEKKDENNVWTPLCIGINIKPVTSAGITKLREIIGNSKVKSLWTDEFDLMEIIIGSK